MKKFTIVFILAIITVPLAVFAQGIFNYDLSYGTSKRTDVVKLQKFLSDLGYLVTIPDSEVILEKPWFGKSR